MQHSPFSRALAVALPLLMTAPAFAQWSQAQLSIERDQCAATSIAGKAFFVGGISGSTGLPTDVIDVYDDATRTWSTLTLSLARVGVGAASADGKVYFGGGLDFSTFPPVRSDIVDVLDVATGAWTTLQLPTVSGETTATSVGSRVLFCNGLEVDILETSAGTWSSTLLSQPRASYAVTSVGRFAIFAGGLRNTGGGTVTDAVDVYDSATGTWSVDYLSSPRRSIAATSVGGRAYFGGGLDQIGFIVDTVDVFDAATRTWSVDVMPVGTANSPATSIGDKAIFAGFSGLYVIYDSAADRWTSTTYPNQTRLGGATSVATRALFAGGMSCAPHSGTGCWATESVTIYDDAIGTTYCGSPVPNSTGRAATLSVLGYPGAVSQGFVHVAAGSLPVGTFGFFLTSRAQGNAPGAGGSQGTLCLGGAIGRFVGPGQIQQADATGHIALSVDLTALPQPTGAIAAAVGDTWNFQAWYRDANPAPTSNFTDAVGVVLQ